MSTETVPLPFLRVVHDQHGRRVVVSLVRCQACGRDAQAPHAVALFADCVCGERVEIAATWAEA
jgi:hypothetical protein